MGSIPSSPRPGHYQRQFIEQLAKEMGSLGLLNQRESLDALEPTFRELIGRGVKPAEMADFMKVRGFSIDPKALRAFLRDKGLDPEAGRTSTPAPQTGGTTAAAVPDANDGAASRQAPAAAPKIVFAPIQLKYGARPKPDWTAEKRAAWVTAYVAKNRETLLEGMPASATAPSELAAAERGLWYEVFYELHPDLKVDPELKAKRIAGELV